MQEKPTAPLFCMRKQKQPHTHTWEHPRGKKKGKKKMVNMQGAIKLSPNAACFLEFHSLLEQDAHVACFRWSWGSFHDERINAPWPSAGGTLCSRFHSFISGSCRVHLCVQRRGRVRTVPAQRDLRLTGWQRHSLQSTNRTKHYESSRERRKKKKK